MEKIPTLLKPARLDLDPSSTGAAKQWKHWYCTFLNFIEECKPHVPDRLQILVNFVSPEVYEYIEECRDFDSAIKTLQELFVKTPNEIFARHILATRKQHAGESLDEFLQDLKKLSKDCNFKSVSAEQYREEMIRDAFINGLSSPIIRQRLLENKSLDLKTAFEQASLLDRAQRNSEVYSSQIPVPTTQAHFSAAVATPNSDCTTDYLHDVVKQDTQSVPVSAATFKNKNRQCFFCGASVHNRKSCPARDATCNFCGKKGHFSKVCLSKKEKGSSAAMHSPALCSAHSQPPVGLTGAITSAKINDQSLTVLVDTGSSDSFISEKAATDLHLKKTPVAKSISMAQSTLKTDVSGLCVVELELENCTYQGVRLYVLKNLCTDIILGQDFQTQHGHLIIEYGGSRSDLKIKRQDTTCALSAASVEEPSLFNNVKPNCKPVASKSRRFSKDDQSFIASEIRRLLDEGIIEPSTSPWRAQIVVSKDELNRHKKRMCVDYSQTINLFTELDAYPLPRIDDLVNDLAQYTVFSTFDLKSAYHQIKIKESDKKYTAFEANGKLYQFCRIPFGVTNGVAVFQRAMDKLVEEEGLQNTFPYIDNITIAGHTQEEHDRNVSKFMEVISRRKLTLNEEKSVLSSSSINILGYLVGNGTIQPDPERLQPLQELPPPTCLKSLRRVLGMFAYYAKWIPNFSDKIQPLQNVESFPLTPQAHKVFGELKKELLKAMLYSIDENKPFVVECDASDVAISATLNQDGRPVAFMSRTLQGGERHYPAIEKEATAIIEAVRKWSHLLSRQHFTLITDQRSVAFMFDNRRRTKIKNQKIQEWRLELASYSYTIQYRPGSDNTAPDMLSRATCASIPSTTRLTDLHVGLCHPGVTRLLHFVCSKNLPFSTEEVRRECAGCRVCAEIKPSFYRLPESALIKATQPMERLSIDFKGPLPSSTRNKYILTVVDEYSRFPFAFPCPDMRASTVIKCLEQLFALCGTPGFIHSDRGSSFMSKELKDYLSQWGIATSKSTPYHPTGNSQVERYNGIIWKTVQLSLHSKGLTDRDWELVIPEALHSIRSLLSTATNTTPHERFFGFQRRSSFGLSLPSWMSPGPVLLRRFVRTNAESPLVDPVELLDANPTYAHIRYPDGRESTVSLRDLAPCPRTSIDRAEAVEPDGEHEHDHVEKADAIHQSPDFTSAFPEASSPAVRRSTRVSKVPDRYEW